MEARNILFLLTILSIIIFCNCKRHDKEIIHEKGISIKVEGIDEFNDDPNELVSNSQRSPYKKIKGSQDYLFYQEELNELNGIDMDLIIREGRPQTLAKTRSTALTTPMEGNRKYIVVVYNTDENRNPISYFAQAQGRANSQINIPAYRNKQYLCIVYSYNSEADIPPFDPSNPFLNISASSSLGTDFLFSYGYITTSDDPNTANTMVITFKRMVSTIRLQLNARGVFSRIVSATVEFPTASSPFRNGTFSVLTGQFTGFQNQSTITRNTWNNLLGDTVPTGWVKYYDFLTVPNGNPIELRPQIKGLVLESLTVDPNNPPNLISAQRSMGDFIPRFTAFTPERGVRYTVELRMKESAINFAESRWARGNLSFFKDDKGNKYRFWYNNNYVSENNGGLKNFIERDYFDTRLPISEPQAASMIWDPCDSVYPRGTWRLPTVAEWTQLFANNYRTTRKRKNQVNDKGLYISWENAAPESPTYAHRNLNLVAAGYRDINRTLQNYKNQVSNFLDNPGDLGYFRTSDTSLFAHIKYHDFGLLLSQPSLKIDSFDEVKGANVRCVRK